VLNWTTWPFVIKQFSRLHSAIELAYTNTYTASVYMKQETMCFRAHTTNNWMPFDCTRLDEKLTKTNERTPRSRRNQNKSPNRDWFQQVTCIQVIKGKHSLGVWWETWRQLWRSTQCS